MNTAIILSMILASLLTIIFYRTHKESNNDLGFVSFLIFLVTFMLFFCIFLDTHFKLLSF